MSDDRTGLVDCPWCHSNEHLRVHSGGILHQVRCEHQGDCDDVRGPLRYGYDAAVEAWNHRAQSSAADTGVVEEVTERAAQIIYDAFPFDGTGDKPPWVPGGNSIRQDDARRAARLVLATIDTSPTTRAALRETLEWYAGEAEAAQRPMTDREASAEALTAILTVLANAAGRRARTAICRMETEPLQSR